MYINIHTTILKHQYSHAITKTNTDIDNLLNIQDNASINTSINTYIKANTTMNNPNTNINIKTPININSHIHIDMNTNSITNRHLQILMYIKIHTTILKYRYILMHSCTNVLG